MIRGLVRTCPSTRFPSPLFSSCPSSNCPSAYQVRGARQSRCTNRSTRNLTLGAPLRSQYSIITIVTAGACIVLAATATFYGASQSHLPERRREKATVTLADQGLAADTAIMSQPGRPGNLTPEQEAKLKEFWKTAFKVFGVTTTSSAADDLLEEVEDEAPVNGSGATQEKEKKKKRNIFSRKKKNKEGKSDDNSSVVTGAADAEDKYGQTKEFFEALHSNTPEELHRAFWTNVKHENPDALLLRFLRARKWDIEKALVMMISTLQWRHREMHVEDDIVKGGEALSVEEAKSEDKTKKKDADDFLMQMRKGKSFVHGLDKEGRPVTLVRVRLHHGGEQSERSIERFTVYTFETTRFMLVPPADTGSLLFDMTGFSLANMDYTPVKFMIKCFEANYPESLGVAIVHKAPWVFQGIWKIIKGWLDPVVANKVHFTNSISELEQYIDKSNIVKEMGGDDPFDYEFIPPQEGENQPMEDTATRDRLQAGRAESIKNFEELTAEWIGEGGADSAAIQSRRTELAQQLMKGYWDLDPYVRARSFYDRVGVLQPGGKVDWSQVVGRKSPHTFSGTDAGSSVAGAVPAQTDGIADSGAGAQGSGASTVAAGVESHVADKAATPNAPPLGSGAAAVAVGSEDQVADQAATAAQHGGPAPAGHDPDGLD